MHMEGLSFNIGATHPDRVMAMATLGERQAHHLQDLAWYVVAVLRQMLLLAQAVSKTSLTKSQCAAHGSGADARTPRIVFSRTEGESSSSGAIRHARAADRPRGSRNWNGPCRPWYRMRDVGT